MEINYNVTGPDRKRLVQAIAEILESEAKYLGVPSCAYQVDNFTIGKDGTLSFDDRADSKEIENLLQGLAERGFDAEAPVPAFESLQMTEEEELGLGRQRHEDPQGENGMQASDVPEPDEDIGLVIEMPLSSFTDTALDNLKRLVDSKGKLIKKALGTETIEKDIADDKVRFPWFEDGTDPDAVKAYTHFVAALCEMARVQKRITAKEKETDNDKYAFRCFLLRLGFIGSAYKEERKILLCNLSGSSAFRDGQKKGFSQDDLDKAKADPAVRAEIYSILGGNDDEQ